jgi:hypothetical protein
MHYTIGTWSGLPNYSCTHCPFSTLGEAEMLQHIIDRHLPRAPEPEQPAEKEEPAPEIMHPTEMPVLLVTPEQLQNIVQAEKQKPEKSRVKKSRKEN